MSGRRREPVPATTEAVTQGQARAIYIRCFLDDDTMRAQLQSLHTRQSRCAGEAAAAGMDLDKLRWLSEDPAHAALVAACDALAATMRLPELASRAFYWLGDTWQLTTDKAVSSAADDMGGFGYSAGAIGDIEVGRSERTVAGVRIIEIDRRPLVRVTTGEWDPDRESRRDAEARLVGRAQQRIRAELGRIEAHAEASGYVFPDTRATVARDIEWLVQHVRDGRPLEALDSTGLDRSAISRAVNRAAALVGVAS